MKKTIVGAMVTSLTSLVSGHSICAVAIICFTCAVIAGIDCYRDITVASYKYPNNHSVDETRVSRHKKNRKGW